MLRHEVDRLRRDLFGRNDQVTFVLTILIIDEDDEFSLLDVPNRFFNSIEWCGHKVSNLPFQTES